MPDLRRRDFIMLLGGAAAAWPLAVRAQQGAMPVIGFLGLASPIVNAPQIVGWRQGLNETGYFEDRNIVVEYRWAEGQFDRLPTLASELIARQPAAIFAHGPPAVTALKAQQPHRLGEVLGVGLVEVEDHRHEPEVAEFLSQAL
jgi:putative ABC transport system substrate-binding protein